MKTFIAILGLALAAMSFAAPSYSADIQTEKKAVHEVAKQQEKAVKEAEKKAAKALAKQKKEQQKAVKKAEKVAKKPGKNPPQAHAVPEINSSYAVLAISLLAGLILIRRESRSI
jgi:ferric-dicitrate binding protein FerR (iron transport regulator)